VSGNRDRGKRRPQFTIRAALFATLLIALAFGWYLSERRADERIARLFARVNYAEAELQWSKSRNKTWSRDRSERKRPPNGVLSLAQLDGLNLRDASIVGGAGAFQRTSFNECDLENASLRGDGGAFQFARFDHANLVNIKLTGGGSSFQLASFVNADLSGAVLTGGAASFQGATFERAKLIGTQVLCSGSSFQLVNIDGAQFQGADLSMLDGHSLESCYFKTPPKYDERTRFPAGFDPAGQFWTLQR
jgi:uncharacterized protein YjbI with pentapeptide repeats